MKPKRRQTNPKTIKSIIDSPAAKLISSCVASCMIVVGVMKYTNDSYIKNIEKSHDSHIMKIETAHQITMSSLERHNKTLESVISSMHHGIGDDKQYIEDVQNTILQSRDNKLPEDIISIDNQFYAYNNHNNDAWEYIKASESDLMDYIYNGVKFDKTKSIIKNTVNLLLIKKCIYG